MHTKCKHESVEMDHCGFREEYPIVKTVQKLCCQEKPYFQKKKWRLFRSKGLKYVYVIIIFIIVVVVIDLKIHVLFVILYRI